MGTNTKHGFTIIETMLFLAITGFLVIAILVGSGVSIGQQRYRDSVNSLKAYIQQQYNEAGSIVNGRGSAWTCNAAAAIAETPPASGQSRGTSECVILGRYITVDEAGTKLTASNVVGYKSGTTATTSDITELKTNYTLSVSPINQETKEVSWGAQVVKQKTTTPMPFSMLIIRSPLSGSVLGFTAEGVQANPSALITIDNANQTRDLCVNTDAGTFVGKRMEVKIDPYPTNQNAIKIPTESESVCD
jgi:type II secretory pathway pseudopilin PulG